MDLLLSCIPRVGADPPNAESRLLDLHVILADALWRDDYKCKGKLPDYFYSSACYPAHHSFQSPVYHSLHLLDDVALFSGYSLGKNFLLRSHRLTHPSSSFGT